MAELNIAWETLDKLPVPEKAAPVVTGEGTPTAAAESTEPTDAPRATADKPYMIYVIEPGAVGSFDTVSKVILEDDRVKLGLKAFHAVKMTPAEAKADPTLAKDGGKEVPRLIFVSADFKTVKALEGGALKLGETWSLMKTTANRFYKQDLDTVVKGIRDVLIEFDKVNAERSVLEEKEKRLTDKATPADKKEIETKRSQLEAREKKAQAQKDKLWDLKPKGEKAA
jgi:hypothetical protein